MADAAYQIPCKHCRGPLVLLSAVSQRTDLLANRGKISKQRYLHLVQLNYRFSVSLFRLFSSLTFAKSQFHALNFVAMFFRQILSQL